MEQDKKPTDPLMLGMLARQDEHQSKLDAMPTDAHIIGIVRAEVNRILEKDGLTALVKALQQPTHREVTAHLPSGPVKLTIKETRGGGPASAKDPIKGDPFPETRQ